jgi:hypothetical protein
VDPTAPKRVLGSAMPKTPACRKSLQPCGGEEGKRRSDYLDDVDDSEQNHDHLLSGRSGLFPVATKPERGLNPYSGEGLPVGRGGAVNVVVTEDDDASWRLGHVGDSRRIAAAALEGPTVMAMCWPGVGRADPAA